MRLRTTIAELPALSFLAEPETVGSTRDEMDAYQRGEVDQQRRAEIETCARLGMHRLAAWRAGGSC